MTKTKEGSLLIMSKELVFGHQKPDTDAIVAAGEPAQAAQ